MSDAELLRLLALLLSVPELRAVLVEFVRAHTQQPRPGWAPEAPEEPYIWDEHEPLDSSCDD